MKKENQIILTDQEKIILSRIYKLDKKMGTFIKNHSNESMNKLIPKTDFIKNTNELYLQATKRVIEISLKNTKYIQNLCDVNKILNKK